MNTSGTPPEPEDENATRAFPVADGGRTPTIPSTNPDIPPAIAEPLPDTGRFRRISLHRTGGMGRIHLALDTELNRRVAFKEVRPDLAHHTAILDHFLFEAEVTGRLEHPGVVPVYGLGRFSDGRPYYAMRFITGESLEDAIAAFHGPTGAEGSTATSSAADRAVALRRLLTRFLAVCQTIAFAHSQGIIHRDLKPSNVMLGAFGETLLVDWGLALEMRNAKREARNDDASRTELFPIPRSSITPQFAKTRTAIGGRAGSPGYWSPEQAAGDVERQSERTDVYGLGAILYHLLTGGPPHPEGEHAPEPPSPKAAVRWVDDVLDGITRRALALDPADRYAFATELAAEVERWLADQPVAAQRAVVAAIARRAEEHPDDPVIQEQLARQRANLGVMLSGMGRDTDAVRELTDAADVFARLFAANPTLPRFRAEEANCYLSAAQALENLGRSEEAAERRKAASDIYAGLVATHPGEFKANIATLIVTHAGEPEGEQHPDQTLNIGPPTTPGTVPPGSVFGGTRVAAGEPELIQGYTVLRSLGQGGLGRVLLARDNVLNRLVAIKDFFPSLPEAARVRVVRELQVTARLIHPNIIRMYTYGIHSDGTRPFMVMEYVPGQSLQGEARAFHATAGILSVGETRFARMISAVAQAADGIHFAHTQGVLHRDPKPSNIMIEEDSGRAVVIDWGLARVTGALDLPASAEHPGQVLGFPADVGVTHEGAVLGTPAYMSPEQAAGRATGPPSDIYSLGAGLFEALTGTTPYVAANVNELLRQVLFGKPHRPRDLNAAVPVELEAICAAAMAYRPEDRYPTAAAMAGDLRAWLSGKPLSIRHRGRLRRLWDQLTGRG
jgi:serine/threonine protein kinase